MSDLFRSGRGGAGNYHPKDGGDKALEEDLEAQDRPTSANMADLTRQITASKPPPEYQNTGRGGAGNVVQPKTLTSQGLKQESSLPGHDASQKALQSSKPMYRGGRGGAGNYMGWEEEERLKKEKEDEEKRMREEVEKKVERDVESGLARPEKAYGRPSQSAEPGVGSWEMAPVRGMDKS